MVTCRLRDATPADLPALAAIFEDAVRTAGPARYTPEQVEAWAARSGMVAAHVGRAARTIVAEVEGVPAGFVTLEPGGRIGMLYVRGDGQRRGLGGRLLAAAIDAADAAGLTRLRAEASAFSRPVFERAGFVVEGTRTVERGGVRFTQHLMARPVRGADG